MTLLQISDINHNYPGKKIGLGGVSLRVEPGDIGCLMGPSGSGKTTVLSCVAGLEPITAGQILLGGRQLSAHNKIVPPEKRRIGMVFQDFALFPHLDVAANIRFGADNDKTVDEMCGLSELCRAYPHELSGGEQQRAALARLGG